MNPTEFLVVYIWVCFVKHNYYLICYRMFKRRYGFLFSQGRYSRLLERNDRRSMALQGEFGRTVNRMSPGKTFA